MNNPRSVEPREVLSARWLNVQRITRVSALVLGFIFAAYCLRWVVLHSGFLFDPRLQNDDARTALFPFHEYGINPLLAKDPIAREMMSYVTPGLWALYRVLVPLTNLFVAAKIVQALALGVLAWAGVLLARSKRGGLAAGLLLVFVVLSDPYAIGRIAGGHARSFAFPCFALWVAGVLAKQRFARFAAPLLGAIFYPAVMLMILAAEGFYTLRRCWRLRPSLVLRRVRHAVFLFLACGLLSLPSVVGGDSSRGPIHTLAQAQRDPAFFGNGRLWVLPLGDPWRELSGAFLARFSASGQRLLGHAVSATTTGAAAIALVLLTGLVVLRWQRRFALSDAVIAFVLGSVTLYFASRLLAFRLYSTERYYAYCMRMASGMLLVGATAGLCAGRRSYRVLARNAFATLIIVGQWLFLGDGIIGNNGMTLDARWDADLYAYVRSLPLDARFASHPLDGDGIPYFGARATTGTFETLQPWFFDSWQRQKRREFATLDMLYTEHLRDVISYARTYSVSHLLLNRDRYGKNFVERAASFEPFTAYTQTTLNQPGRGAPALANPPAASIVFERKPWVVIDVERLRASLQPDPSERQAPTP